MTVHVFSDGMPENTHVIGPDGTEIKGIVAMSISGEVKQPIKITLEISQVPLDVDARVDEVTLRCALCGHDATHSCGTMG